MPGIAASTTPASLAAPPPFRVNGTNSLAGSIALLLLGLAASFRLGRPLPFSLAPLGLPSCSLSVSPDFTFGRISIGSGPGEGTAFVPFSIPPNPVVSGSVVYLQWYVYDPCPFLPLPAAMSRARKLHVLWSRPGANDRRAGRSPRGERSLGAAQQHARGVFRREAHPPRDLRKEEAVLVRVLDHPAPPRGKRLDRAAHEVGQDPLLHRPLDEGCARSVEAEQDHALDRRGARGFSEEEEEREEARGGARERLASRRGTSRPRADLPGERRKAVACGERVSRERGGCGQGPRRFPREAASEGIPWIEGLLRFDLAVPRAVWGARRRAGRRYGSASGREPWERDLKPLSPPRSRGAGAGPRPRL